MSTQNCAKARASFATSNIKPTLPDDVNPDQFDDSRPVAPWVFRIAYNRCVDFLRCKARETAEVNVSDPESIPAAGAVSLEIRPAIERLVLTLPPKERACVLLKEVFEYSLEEIAEPKQLTDSIRTVRKNTILIAEDIPEEQYGYRPTADSRSVAENLIHIAMVSRLDRILHEEEHV